MFQRERFSWQFGLESKQIALLAILHQNDNKVGGCVSGKVTGELILISHNVVVVELLHDVDLLIDVFLKEGLLLYVAFADYLHRVEQISRL
jgi:hypothetical protein